MVDCTILQSAVIDSGFEVLSGKSLIGIHVHERSLLWWIPVFNNLVWWVVGLPAHGVFLRACYPCRSEATAMVDCRVDQYDVTDCGFEVFSAEKCYSYPRR